MILSHDHQFIFIKTRKTAGTSVEMALSPHCGPIDILTPIFGPDERLRMKEGLAPRNYMITGPYKAGTQVPENKNMQRVLQAKREFHTFRNHSTAEEVKNQVGDTVWGRYFTFAIERNPWDFLVSDYFWHQRMPAQFDLDFDTFLRQPKKTLNWDIYTKDDVIIVDHIIRYENLTKELSDLKSKLGFDISDKLPNAKGNTNRKKRDYKDFYNEEQRLYVAKEYEKVIDTFKYVF